MLDVVRDETINQAAGGVALPAAPRVKTQGIAILGSHPMTVMQAPFDREEWLIYACSPHNVEHRTLPRSDQWFELHDPIEDATRSFLYLTAVSRMPQVWMRDEKALKSGLFKGGRRYPDRELVGTFRREKVKTPTGNYRPVKDQATGKTGFAEVHDRREVEVPNMDGKFYAHMFTSSIAYMLAKAICDCEEQNIGQIGLWGIMQASNEEYVFQRPGIQYFLAEAQKRGIKIIANRESCLFDMPQWKW